VFSGLQEHDRFAFASDLDGGDDPAGSRAENHDVVGLCVEGSEEGEEKKGKEKEKTVGSIHGRERCRELEARRRD
jgi:hypothetical protein